MNRAKAKEMAEEQQAAEAVNAANARIEKRMRIRRSISARQLQLAIWKLEAWQDKEANHRIPEYEEVNGAICHATDALQLLVAKLRT